METQSLKVQIRAERGKGPAKKMRANDELPAVVYGRGLAGTALTLSPKALVASLGTKFGRNVLFKLDLGKTEEFAMLRELQIHPVTRRPVHADFLRVDPDVAVEVRVPLTTGGRAKGVVQGGELRVNFRTLPIVAKPGQIPAAIVVDVTELGMHQSTRVKDLKLPDGVRVALPAEQAVVAVATERKVLEEEVAAVPGAATPAAGAAPAAAKASAAKAPAAKK